MPDHGSVEQPSEPRRAVGYGIGAVARQLGVAEATIRSWERRYGVVAPLRTPGGQRRYSTTQIEQLRAIQARLSTGMRPGEAFAEVARARPRSSTSLSRPAAAAEAALVLVVARTELSAEPAAAALRHAGYGVAVCAEPGAAADVARELEPDVSIVDLLVDGGRGREVCTTLKATTGAPVVALSSLDVEASARAAGADAFVAVPVQGRRLVEAVEGVLDAVAS